MTVLGMSWDRCEMVWGSFGDRVGFVLEHFFTVLEQLCDRLGQVLVHFYGFWAVSFGTVLCQLLGPSWERSGTVLGLLWDRSGPLWSVSG